MLNDINKYYLLQIDIDKQPHKIYKIGATRRNIKDRLFGIRHDLSKYFKSFAIKVLGVWTHRENIETYFLKRYSSFRYPIGTLTEYFTFTELEIDNVLADLKRIKANLINTELFNDEKFNKRSEAIRRGMKAAKNWGQIIGRPSTSENVEAFLNKPTSKKVIEALNNGLSLRKAARCAGVAVNTVRKVKDAMA